MSAILYPPCRVIRQSFHGVKRQTVPKQSLSLQEIVRRFIRNEPLPASRDGVYEERFGDLEKLSRLDILEKMEAVSDLRSMIAAFQVRESERAKHVEKTAHQAAIDAAVSAALASAAREGKPAQNPAP